MTLDKLHITVAEKLGHFPGLVKLQYRLSNDITKVGAISIQTNKELLPFKDRLRKIIIPPHLANGRASTRTPKAVLVYFEDASSEMKETLASGNSSKKVYIFFMLYFVAKYYYCRILCHLHHVKIRHPFQMVKLNSKLGR